MAVRWTVLASGSGGNASLLEIGDAALLLDVGLGPRQLASRLRTVGQCWNNVRAVLLTHTHSDHWNQNTLERMSELGIPIFCHREHERELQLRCPGFQALQLAGLVRNYDMRREFTPIDGVRCRPLTVPHDGGPTFGFRIEGDRNLSERGWSIGYAADLGSWDHQLAQALAEVDVLALEFNHDVELQRASGRSPWLIERVLGDQGHLSNVQGAQFLRECLCRSTPGRVQHVIQLHLSRQCNRPSLAIAAARDVFARLESPPVLHTAEQDRPGRTIRLVDE